MTDRNRCAVGCKGRRDSTDYAEFGTAARFSAFNIPCSNGKCIGSLLGGKECDAIGAKAQRKHTFQ